jgi:hypothetical protein
MLGGLVTALHRALRAVVLSARPALSQAPLSPTAAPASPPADLPVRLGAG